MYKLRPFKRGKKSYVHCTYVPTCILNNNCYQKINIQRESNNLKNL